MGLLDDGTEYLRRSGRNLGGLFDFLGGNATAGNAAIKSGANATRALLAGRELTPEQREALHNSPIGGFGPENLGAGGALMGTYVGIGAKTANKAKLAQAQSAIKGGMDPEAARQRFGWFQDPTGDWKFEISDHKAQLKQDKAGNWVLAHPELERAYPGMVKGLKIDTMPAKNSLGQDNPLLGLYLKDTNTAKLNESLLANPEEATGTLMHELQHGVQFKEGFSPGTHPASDEVRFKVDTEQMPKWHALHEREAEMRDQRNKWMSANKDWSLDDFYKKFPGWTDRYDTLLKQIREHPSYNEMTHNTYESALGEVEARDTMNRLRYLPDDRKRNRPYVGEGVPPGEIWDMREVRGRLYPKKVADEPDPQELRGLLDRTLGPSPETKGTLLSLLALGLFPKDAE